MKSFSSAVKKKEENITYLNPVEDNHAYDYERPSAQSHTEEQPDHFIMDESGVLFAGHHLIVDLWDVVGSLLSDMELVTRALTEACSAAGASLLNIDLHRFEPNGGISGVAVLAESHMSIHTWPERGYAAIDAFMCGKAKPSLSINVLRSAFMPGKINSSEFRRGIVGKQ